MKKLFIFMMAIFILSAFMTVALAATTVSVSKSTAQPSETVTISGTTSADENVVIKVVDSAGNIIYFGADKADGNGNYSASFTIPVDCADGTLKVTAGSGNDTASANINVETSPAPTPTPTPTTQPTTQPTANPTAQPTVQPSTVPTTRPTVKPTNEPIATPQPSDGVTLSPSQADTPLSPEPTIIVEPIEIVEDEETDDITIVIDVDDLPESTEIIELPNGETVNVSDAQNGKLTIVINKLDISSDDEIILIPLDKENIPLGSIAVKVDGIKTVNAESENSSSSWLASILWIIGGIAIIIVLIFVLWKQRKKAS